MSQGATTGPQQRISDPLTILADRLREHREAHGNPSMHDLEHRMRTAGHSFPRSTIGEKLTGGSAPSWEFVEAFVNACGLAPDLDEWRELHRRLDGDPERGLRIPHEFPAPPTSFTGRQAEFAAIDAVAAGPDARIALITGTAGVGKTGLALAWAHRHASDFPDGQIYIDLHGFDAAPPVPDNEAPAWILRSLGEHQSDIPSDADACAARLRTVLSGARTLLVLDNACSVEQVRRLLPGDASSMAIVTSRDSLTGLAAVHGAQRVRVRALPIGDAVALLTALVDVGEMERLAEACARLPLALRIAADTSPQMPDLRTTFSWSYRLLSPAAAAAFRLLSVHPGADFDVPAATAAVGVEAGPMLAELQHAHLAEASAGRFTINCLLQRYAQELCTDTEQTAAIRRLTDHYLGASSAAMSLVAPAHWNERPPGTGHTTATFVDAIDARAWLDAESGTILAFVRAAADRGDTETVVRLAAITARYFDIAAYHVPGVALHELALEAARIRADQREEATALRHLGFAQWRIGRTADAAINLELALAIALTGGDVATEGSIRNALGLVHEQLGNLDDSARHLHRAASIAQNHGDPVGEAAALSNLSRAYRQLGRMDEAEDCLVRALPIWRTAGDRSGEARAIAHRGFIRYLRADYDEAFRLQEQALAIFVDVGDPHGQAWAHNGLGRVHQRWRQPDLALDHQRRALTIFRSVGGEYGQGEAHDAIGDVLFLQDSFDAAQQHHRDALALARAGGHRLLEARALNGLADDITRTGDPDLAYDLHKQALHIAIDTGDGREQARAHQALARLYRQAGHADAAADHDRQAAAALG